VKESTSILTLREESKDILNPDTLQSATTLPTPDLIFSNQPLPSIVEEKNDSKQLALETNNSPVHTTGASVKKSLSVDKKDGQIPRRKSGSKTNTSSSTPGRPRGRSVIRKAQQPKWQDIPWRLWGVNEVSQWLKAKKFSKIH